MPVVRNVKGRAKGFCDGGQRGRGRRAKIVCSWFVLSALLAGGISRADFVELDVGFSLAFALPTVNGPERSVARESVSAAKRKDAAQASITPCWRHVSRA